MDDNKLLHKGGLGDGAPGLFVKPDIRLQRLSPRREWSVKMEISQLTSAIVSLARRCSAVMQASSLAGYMSSVMYSW